MTKNCFSQIFQATTLHDSAPYLFRYDIHTHVAMLNNVNMTLESEPHMPPSLMSSVAINIPLCSFRNAGRQKSHIVYATMDTKN